MSDDLMELGARLVKIIASYGGERFTVDQVVCRAFPAARSIITDPDISDEALRRIMSQTVLQFLLEQQPPS